jgi:hypothetical protein
MERKRWKCAGSILAMAVALIAAIPAPASAGTWTSRQLGEGTLIAKGKAKVRFRFYAAKHASVRGYVCKLDDRRFKPCESPKAYRVGVGKHLFKVRAVGWTGYRGKAAYHPFEVCRPTEIGFCIDRLPPPQR